MSDLVRGAGAPAPPAAPPVKEEGHETAPAPPSPPARGAPAGPTRLTLRAIDMTTEVPPPALSTVAAPASPVPASTAVVPRSAQSVFDDVHLFLASVRDAVVSGAAPSWVDLEALIRRVVVALEESAELFWLANARTLPEGVEYLVAHQSRVAVLAVRIGLNVGYDSARAVRLGAAGALLDVGLWQTSGALLRRLDSLSAEEQAVYRAHPQRSAALLAQWGAPAEVVDVVLQHHERELGQGFPQHLAGGAVSQDAKILGLVDAYAGLTLPAARRPGLQPHEAIRKIVRSKHDSFSPALIKALLSEISVFPPGTLVRLNTGEVGQVIAVNRNHPLRPRVEVVSDSKGNRPTAPKTIDLSETPFLYITGPVSDSTK